jgi:hypothetical protein
MSGIPNPKKHPVPKRILDGTDPVADHYHEDTWKPYEREQSAVDAKELERVTAEIDYKITGIPQTPEQVLRDMESANETIPEAQRQDKPKGSNSRKQRVVEEMREIARDAGRSMEMFWTLLQEREIPLTKTYRDQEFTSWKEVGEDRRKAASLRRLKSRLMAGECPRF